MKKYKIMKRFIAGHLKGLQFFENTNVKFKEGRIVRKPVAGSPYIILQVIKNKER